MFKTLFKGLWAFSLFSSPSLFQPGNTYQRKNYDKLF